MNVNRLPNQICKTHDKTSSVLTLERGIQEEDSLFHLQHIVETPFAWFFHSLGFSMLNFPVSCRFLCFCLDRLDLCINVDHFLFVSLRFSLKYAIERFSWGRTAPIPTPYPTHSTLNSLSESGKARTSVVHNFSLIVAKLSSTSFS